MFILKTGHQPGVYVPLRALFLVITSTPVCYLIYVVHSGVSVILFIIIIFISGLR